MRRFARVQTDGNPTFVDSRYFRFKALRQHDVQAEIKTPGGYSFYLGINNLANERPDIGFDTNAPISPLGRYLYAGAKLTI